MKHVALITGASSGIGKQLAVIHAERGNDLILVARRADRLEQLRQELTETFKVKVEIIVKDLSQPFSAHEIYKETEKKGIAVEYLINNAGFAGHGYFHERLPEEDLDMLNVNVTSLMLLTKLYLPGMVARGRGKIMNVSSTASFIPGPLQAVYYASKAFVTSFSQALSEELRNTGVTVTALCPGLVDTEFIDLSGMGESNIAKFQKGTSSEKTARIGYRDMMKGKLLSFDRPLLRITLRWLVPFIPRITLLKISRKTMEKRWKTTTERKTRNN
jgi:short-subunit dehydrogenase